MGNDEQLAEGVGFEPTVGVTHNGFKTVAINRSATPPCSYTTHL